MLNLNDMIYKDETIPGAFPALRTGYSILGNTDYAYLPAASVPELSLAGDRPFTLFTVVCFKNVQGGALLRQENMFTLSIMDGRLYVAGLDWCAVKFAESVIGRLVPDRWYSLALVYDGNLLTTYLDGEKKDTSRCKLRKKYASNDNLTIGNKLDACFKSFRLFGRALSGEEVRLLESDEGISPEESIVWFDFDKTGRKDRSPKQMRILTKAFARIVIVKPVRQFRFSISRRYLNVEEMVAKLLVESKSVSFTGCLGSKPDTEDYAHFAGMVSFGTPKPVMCELEGEMVTIWESIDIPQTD